jgi:site-specific recombinase XerD
VLAVEYEVSPQRRGWALLHRPEEGAPSRLTAPSQYLEALVAARVPRNTQKARAHDLALFFGWCDALAKDWRMAQPGWITAYLTDLSRVAKGAPLRSPERVVRIDGGARASSTIRRNLDSVKSFFSWAATCDLVSERVAWRVCQVRAPRVPTRMSADRLTPVEVTEVFDSVVTRPRERFLLELEYSCGLRLSEALGLMFEDVHLNVDNRSLGCSVAGPHIHVVVRGEDELPAGVAHKSEHDRVVPLPHRARAAYADWCVARLERVGEDDVSPFVFVTVVALRRGSAWSAAAAEKTLWRCGQRLRPPLRDSFHGHLLRHTYASELADAGVDSRLIQALLGHRSIESMTVYVHPDARLLTGAVEQLDAWRTDRFGQ